VREGWFNVDGFDVTYPGGTIEPALARKIFRVDLTQPHPFESNYFQFGYAEDFLEHLSQADSLIFLSECFRTFAPGGVLRLSFPGLPGVLRRHYRSSDFQGASQGREEAYLRWLHQHFYCKESLDLVARHIGFRECAVVSFRESRHPELRDMDTRADQQDLNLIVELTK
jgi:predicted SAM-dependent methyltransferase